MKGIILHAMVFVTQSLNDLNFFSRSFENTMFNRICSQLSNKDSYLPIGKMILAKYTLGALILAGLLAEVHLFYLPEKPLTFPHKE